MNKNGFTLIELLVAVAIMGVLATLVMTNMQGVRERARDVARKSDLGQIKTALRLYYNDNQSYPEADTSSIKGCDAAVCAWGSAFVDNGNTYMKKLPTDPLGSGDYTQYYYTVDATGDDFTLTACLENASDSDKDSSVDALCGSAAASYTITAN